MMKKIVAVAFSALLLATVFAGCAGNAQQTPKAEVSNVTTETGTQNPITDSAAPGAAPNGGQDGQGAPNGDTGKSVMGEITQIDGSKITLKIAEMPDRQQNGQDRQDGQNTDPKPSMDPNSTPPQPDEGGGKGNGRPSIQLTFTGETQVITIPDGVTILKMENGRGPGGKGGNGQGQQAQGQQDGQAQDNGNGGDKPAGTPNLGTQISLSDLKPGWILTIHYAQDGTTIESITAYEPIGTAQNNA